jgi:hypothetical protein
MKLERSFTKVYIRTRKPLQFKGFLCALEKLLGHVDEIVIDDVRFALTGEKTKQDAPCPSARNVTLQTDK